MQTVTKDTIFLWLEEVKDPEIPVISIVDMGIISDVIIDGEKIHITITPTFVGCPALDTIKSDITGKLKERGILEIAVSVSFQEPWSSDKISEKGKEALKRFGISPPPLTNALIDDLSILEHAQCPRCKSTDTQLKNIFGPALCRSIHYCYHCQDAFEQFKPI